MKIKEVISVSFVFALFKSLVFIAPLGVSYSLQSFEAFGEFEYSLNIGQALMGFISMGFAGTYAYFIIKKDRPLLKPVFHFHFIAITTALCLIVLITPSILTNSIFTAFVVGTAMADQVFLSATLKLNGKNALSIVVDSGLYIVMGFLVFLDVLGILDFTVQFWNISLLLGLVATVFLIHLKEGIQISANKLSEIKSIYAFGGLIIITGPLLVLINASTRLYIEHFLSIEDVGVYSYLFRFASVTLILSRVFVILMYRQMFMNDHNFLDKNYSKIIYFLLIISALVLLILPSILKVYFPLFNETFSDNKSIFLLCFFQIIFWVTTSLFEPILQRENKIKWFILVLLICNLLMIGIASLYDVFLTLHLTSIVWINCLIIFILVLFQIYILWKNNIRYKRSLVAHLFVGLLFFSALLYI